MNSKRQRTVRMSMAALPLAVAMLAVTACGGQSPDQGGQASSSTAAGSPAASAAAGPPTEISMMSIFYQKEPPAADNVILKEVEKRTNTKLNITWVTPNNFGEKVNVTLASGDLPDLMLVTDTGNAAFRNMAKQGAFWDLTEKIKAYPNLMKYPAITYANTKIEGKLYGVPRVRPTEGNAQPLIRVDWLNKLNLKMPETVDDLYNVMKAFKENAPDGQKDTVGFSGYVNEGDMGQFGFIESAFTNSNGKYKVKDGNLIDVTFEPEMRQMLEWFNRAYKEGLIPQDFALLKHNQAKDLVSSGKAGIFADKPNQEPNFIKDIKSIVPGSNPDMQWMPYLIGPSGAKFAAKGTGHFGMFVIPKKVPEAKVNKLLEFLNYGMSDEGHELANYGLKDTHFKLENGTYTLTDAALKDPSFQFMQNIFMKYDKYSNVATAGLTADQIARDKKLIDVAEPISTPYPLSGLVSETNNKLGSEYGKKIQDLKTKVIMGKATLADWDQFVAGLKQDKNYMKILEEFNEAYHANGGK
ncbi:extracellular solute-binding protein [Paenibacillus ferrarius]|uniref:extracellular solute-binding protein n=1 Tax=Paenibacillus ferrarius TaxID=1469647 RepID=UPI003D2DEBC0